MQPVAHGVARGDAAKLTSMQFAMQASIKAPRAIMVINILFDVD
jgi:hypothetical protein